jgi:cytoskeletal protein CcmA (bactofilin family)
MALFGNKDKPKKRRFLENPAIDPRDPATTVLAEQLTLEGNLETPGDALVAGKVQGDLEVKGRLHLFRGAQVKGQVVAGEAKIEGTVDGPVKVGGKLEVGQSARITGDLNAARLTIAEGALVRGSLNSESEPEQFKEKREET